MKRRKSLLRTSLLLIYLLCLLIVPNSGLAALRVPRVISIVYDDSSSMNSKSGISNAGYANYAIKAFIALLDTRDVVYITLMSEPSFAYRLELSKGADYALEQLDAMLITSGMTPFDSLMTAVDTMQRQMAPDEASIYWLAIFTDGDFQDATCSLDSYFQTFLRKTMPNGTLPQVCYVAIGENANRPIKSMDRLTVYPSQGSILNSEDILKVMRDLADRISGRAKVSIANIIQSGKTVRFTVDTPCFSIAILQQKDAAPWVSLTDQTDKTYSGEKISIITTRNDQILSGWASKISSSEGDVLPAGTYEITFQSPPQDLTIMTEPALLLDLNITPSGSAQTHTENSIVDIQGLLHLWNESSVVSPSLLPDDTTYHLSVIQNGTVVNQTDDMDMLLKNVNIAAATTVVSASVELPNIGRITASKTIALPVYSLSLRQVGSAQYMLRELVGNQRGVIATVLKDGKALDAQEAAVITLNVDSTLPYELTRLSTGEFQLVPFLSKLMPLTSYGDAQATLTLQNIHGITTPQTVTWTVQQPELTLAASLLGTSSVERTALMDSMGILDGVGSEDALTEIAQTQVIAKAQMLLDGVPITAEQMNDWGYVSVKMSAHAASHYRCAVRVLDNGTILCAPYASTEGVLTSPVMRWLGSWYLWHGPASIICSAEWGGEAEIDFNITLEPWYTMLLNYISPLLVLVLLLGYVFKRRFARGASVRWVSIQKSDDALVSGTNEWQVGNLRQFNIWSLIPYARARTKVGGLRFYAGRDMFILTPQKTLARKSFLISQKQCVCRSAFSLNTTSDSIRPVYINYDEATSIQNCVFADTDVLVFTGDGSTGRAYIYDHR